jgi:hypothetical protein
MYFSTSPLRHLCVAVALSVAVSACKKDDETPTPAEAADVVETEMAENFSQTLGASQDILALVADAADNSAVVYRTSTTYPTVTYQDKKASNPDTVIIDFGPTNTTGQYGRPRRGQIIGIFSGPKTAPTSISIKPNNYFVNDNQVTGELKMTATNPSASQPVWTLVVNANVLFSNGKTATAQLNGTRTQVAGKSTTDVASDDVYVITATGSATGTRLIGYSLAITNLRNDLTCSQPTSGTVVLTRRGDTTYGLSFDFGTGACDNLAQVTLLPSNRAYTLTLR